SSTHPCNEKSPSLVPQPRKLNVIAAQPSSLAIRSMSSGNVPALCRASSGPIGKPWHRITPGSGPLLPAGRARYRASVRLPDRNSPFTPCLRSRFAGAAPHAGTRQVITTIAGLDERVGPEAQTGLGGDDVVDDRRVVPVVEVVHQLRALVAEIAGVLETGRPLHNVRR